MEINGMFYWTFGEFHFGPYGSKIDLTSLGTEIMFCGISQ
jgi:hypothetical protein